MAAASVCAAVSKSLSLRDNCLLGPRSTRALSSLAGMHPVSSTCRGGATGRLIWASPGIQKETPFPPQTYTVGAQCTPGLGGRGWVEDCRRVSDARWESETNPSAATVPAGGVRYPPEQRPRDPRLSRQSPGRGEEPPVPRRPLPGRRSPPAHPPRRHPYPAGGRPLGESVQRGRPRHRGDPQQQQQQQRRRRQERQGWRRGHHSRANVRRREQRPGEGAAFNPAVAQPPAGPASRCPRPWGLGLASLGTY